MRDRKPVLLFPDRWGDGPTKRGKVSPGSEILDRSTIDRVVKIAFCFLIGLQIQCQEGWNLLPKRKGCSGDGSCSDSGYKSDGYWNNPPVSDANAGTDKDTSNGADKDVSTGTDRDAGTQKDISTGKDASAGKDASTGKDTSTSNDTSTGKDTNGKGTFHVFFLLGQSNMEGYPKAQQADKVKDERILVLGYDNCSSTGRKINQWDVASPPLHSCWSGAIGPGDYFAKTLVKKIPKGDTIGLIPCAVNGQRIEFFMKGQSQYNKIIQRGKIAQDAGGVIEGMIFHQGESNNGDYGWPEKVKQFVTDIRKDLGLGDIPFIAGELLYGGGCAGHNTLVNKLPSVISNTYVVSAEGLFVDPSDAQWRLHFGHDSQVILGRRYAEKMIQALNW